MSRAEKQLVESKRKLHIVKRSILEDRPVVGKEVIEELQLQWDGAKGIDLCLLETYPLPGFEYRSPVKHCLYISVVGCRTLQNRLCCHTTGRISLGAVHIVISDDWGLFEVDRSLDEPCLPIFYPPVYQRLQLSPQTAMGLSPMMGIHRLSRAGEGSELHEIRDYHPGDSYRKMLWGATARTGRLTVREFAAEVNIPVVFVLNTSWFLRFGSPKMMFDQLVETAMVLASATYDAGDPFGFCLYGDEWIPTKYACQLPEHSQRRLTEMMESLLQIKVHKAPPLILNLPELKMEIAKLLNGKAESFQNYCDSSSINRELIRQGLMEEQVTMMNMEYVDELADIADRYGMPTPIFHSHFKANDTYEYRLELEEVSCLERLLSRLIPMIKDKALFVVSTRPYESNDATDRLCRVLSLIPRRSHRLLVLSPDYPSYTKQSAIIPKNSDDCLQIIKMAKGMPPSYILAALDFYTRRETLRRRILHLGGGFESIDAKKNIQYIIDLINHQRYPQGGQRYA